MRYGIFSDVHGNYQALQAVFAAFMQHRVDRYVCLGDILGYGAQPNECLDLMRMHHTRIILGNHDIAALGWLNVSGYHAHVKEALDYSAQELSALHRQWLSSCEYTHYERGIFFSHAFAYLDPLAFEYLTETSQIIPCLEQYRTIPSVSFIGHSHLTKSFKIQPKHVEELNIKDTCDVLHSCKYIFTVGSVGQPRDKDPRAAAVIYDTQKNRVQYLRVVYDIACAQTHIIQAGLPSVFANRLSQGI